MSEHGGNNKETRKKRETRDLEILETRPKPPYRRQGLAGHLTCYFGFVYQHYFKFHSLKTEFSTHAGSQLTSFDPKTWRHWRRVPTDLHSSKNMTSQMRGPNWGFRCLDMQTLDFKSGNMINRDNQSSKGVLFCAPAQIIDWHCSNTCNHSFLHSRSWTSWNQNLKWCVSMLTSWNQHC